MLKSEPGRGRPRTFDEETAIDAALDQFWRQGYRATTTRNLETALGMSQPSIYNAFGSKRDLLLRTMDLYETRVKRDLLSVLNDHEDGYEAIQHFLAKVSDWIEENKGRGCLMVNMMVGNLEDKTVAQRVEGYRAKIRETFADTISRSETDPSVISARADLLLAAVLGLHIIARTAGSGDSVTTMADNIGRQIADWKAESLV